MSANANDAHLYLDTGANQAAIPLIRTLSEPYSKAFDLVMRETALPIQYFDYPYLRGRYAFIKGDIVIECCISMDWRDWPEEQDVQLFTEPFYAERQVVVSLESRSIEINSLSQLSEYSIGVIRGFTYEDASSFGRQVLADDFDDLMVLLERGRVDTVVIGLPEFVFQQMKRQEKFKISFDLRQHALRFRVHKSRSDLLPVLNRAIQNLKDRGAIKMALENGGK